MLFFHVKTAAEARELFRRPAPALASERLGVTESLGRILAVEVRSPIDFPEFPRAVVDGYAVRAQDTFGASASLPAYLNLSGEVRMGRVADCVVGPGQAVRIATGGMLPGQADAVVMVEYTSAVGDDLVEVSRAAAPGEGMVAVGDDLRRGAGILPAGHRLRPQDLGLLAALGVPEVDVHRRARVAVVPTGDEIVDPSRQPAPGQVRDSNTAILTAAVTQAGAEPLAHDIVPDDPEALRSTIGRAIEESDLVLIAGGSSVGTRDWTLEVLLSFEGAELLLHGVSIRPGKPVIVVALADKLLIGLPGNPVSAMIVFDQFVRPYLRRLSGDTRTLPEASLAARLSRSYSSDPGKEDYVRVRVAREGDGYVAEPVLGKSTLLTTLVEADGIIVVPENVEGLEAGELVEVELY